MYEKTNHSGFLINKKTNVVINRNDSDLQSYRRQVANEKKNIQMEAEVRSLRDELQLIKDMLLNGKG